MCCFLSFNDGSQKLAVDKLCHYLHKLERQHSCLPTCYHMHEFDFKIKLVRPEWISLQLGFSSLGLNFSQFHCQSHVSFNLELALEERLVAKT